MPSSRKLRANMAVIPKAAFFSLILACIWWVAGQAGALTAADPPGWTRLQVLLPWAAVMFVLAITLSHAFMAVLGEIYLEDTINV